jgi:hypothetical protein
MDEFKLWAGACSHVHSDLNRGDRESLASAIRHSEGLGAKDAPSFEWDTMVHLGDTSGTQTSPGDSEGAEVLRQWSIMRDHRREQIYNVVGNHDATGPDEPTQWWFRTWIDPTGNNTDTSGVNPEERPFQVTGTWERYSFRVGNILFLMMGDRNDGGPPSGRRVVDEHAGGYPAGKVTRETFKWWRDKVESNQEKIIVTCHHHMLKDTTVASGPWEGIMGNYHGHFEDGAPEGAGYIYFVGDEHDSGAFRRYLEENPGAIDLWLGGHTHAPPGDRYGGKTHVERKWGVTFVNVAPMTKHHVMKKSIPMTRHFTFSPDSTLVRLRCYSHDEDGDLGWINEEFRRVPLRHSFSGVESDRI